MKELRRQTEFTETTRKKMAQVIADRDPEPKYPGRDYSEKVAQFDIGRNRVTDFDPKSTKDTYYKFDDKHGKKIGMYKPVSTEVGNGLNPGYKYSKPQAGGKSEVSKFFDKSHLTTNRMD